MARQAQRQRQDDLRTTGAACDTPTDSTTAALDRLKDFGDTGWDHTNDATTDDEQETHVLRAMTTRLSSRMGPDNPQRLHRCGTLPEV